MLRVAKYLFSLVLLSTFSTAPVWAQPAVYINELMASNSHANADPQGQYDDWVELYNASETSINVAGMYLTNAPSTPMKWQIPSDLPELTTIPAGGYLIIWLDNDILDEGLHANFELNTSGDQMALFDTTGTTEIDSVDFDDQITDLSYGRSPNGTGPWKYLISPSPGSINSEAYEGLVADTQFDPDRGFYDTPIEVTIASETPEAQIRYTLNGSDPTPVYGILYNGPILIDRTTCLRAVAYKAGWRTTNIDTHTYLFLDDIITQATDPITGAQVTPEGYPTSWGSTTGDYQMDPDVVGQNGTDIFSGLYANTIRDDLKAVPTISLVMDTDDWFGNKGIYINESQDGTERVASIEFIDPCDPGGLQTNCAIAMQGGVSGGGTSLNRWKTYKLSMRPRFKTQTDDGTATGGPSKLETRLFADSPIERFNTVVIDGALNHSWLHSGQHNDAVYIQDQYVADLHNAMGGYSPHGSYAHVYINGLYWGMYYIHERPDHAWAAQMFGGDEDEYDAIKHSSSGVINDGLGGSARNNYNAMLTAASAVASNPDDLATYNHLCELLDVDNFIAYLLTNWFTGNHDWPHKNWYATHRNTPEGRWRFHSWDAEHTVEWTNSFGQSPSDLHAMLDGSAEYHLRFGDLAHRFLFNNGPLTFPAAQDMYKARMQQIDRAIVGESARWGDNRSNVPHTRQDWLDNQESRLNRFQRRPDEVLNWLRSAGLYPTIDAPEFQINGQPQHGGHVAAESQLTIASEAGTIWYTLDDSDPRSSGTVAESSDEYAFVSENAIKRVLIPTNPVDDAWRGGGNFDDSSWIVGSGGVGYENSTGYESYFDIDVRDTMYGSNASCYIRIPFDLNFETLQDASGLRLKVRYDDGFVAYLNGSEIQRGGFSGEPTWNSTADGSHSDTEAVFFETFDISDSVNRLRLGQNILAIHGLNQSTSSSDFLISVELVTTKQGGGAATPSGISPTAIEYRSAIPLTVSSKIKTRAFGNVGWSALDEAVFSVGPVAESLRISEIMYHPADLGHPDDPNTEYIELTNIGTETINLNLVKFTNGVDFIFGPIELTPGGYTLLVRDIAAFETKYGDGLPISGQYAGNLSNSGERIELQDAAGTIIHTFVYKDNWYDATDGGGFSLTVKDPVTVDPNTLGDKASWRSSAFIDGSPGFDDSDDVIEPGAVVINEVMANPDTGQPDWIELHNTTDQAIALDGWFLSDDADEPNKYEIEPDVTISPGGYVVFYQEEHFSFGLSRDGETVYLHSGLNGIVTGYREQESFDASETGVSLGRYLKSTGTYNFVALNTPTPGTANAEPKVGPIVINEIMYNSPFSDDAEFVELLNISDTSVTFYDVVRGAPWRFSDGSDNPGLELLFPTDNPVALAPGQCLLLVKDLVTFSQTFVVPDRVQILEWADGRLANSQEKIQLSKPGDEDADGTRSWVRVDRVVYSDGSHDEDFTSGIDPWPASADGQGLSLNRINPHAYGNDPINWQAAVPSPGSIN